MDTIMTPDRGLLRLLTWLSPAFPVGAYTYSHGLEYTVEAGLVASADDLQGWLEGLLEFGSLRGEALLFARAWRAAVAGDLAEALAVSELADALRPTAELARESSAQGQAFLGALRQVWPHPFLLSWGAGLEKMQRPAPYAMAVALAAALEDIPLAAALAAFLQALAANLVSAGVRLIPLGQTAGLGVLAGLELALLRARDAALTCDPEDWGSASLGADWACMRHETQYTRLFRS
jgi:urease accessory protein